MFPLVVSSLADLPRYQDSGFTHIVSLLDDGYTEVVERAGSMPDIVHTAHHLFDNFLPHQRLELQFDDVTYPNHYYVAPTQEDVETILAFARTIGEDSRVLVHCVAGISRSTAAASLILLQAYPEMSVDEVFEEIVRIRPQAVPNFLILKHGGHVLDRFFEITEAYQRRFSMIR